MTMPEGELERFVKRNGCYCGGHGSYTDYNCGASFERMCPHCRGTGKKMCDCVKVSTMCGGSIGAEIMT